ncbi:MAG TPA: glycosyltransferase family 4 protein [Bryobacteraceae bacterium]|nr:glycosyltransferase family 4 protein [Bryobacteraceae bacterium]
MKLGFFSPLPPASTGVADYSARLLAELRRFVRIEAGAPGDVALYHIGNNQLHRAIYARALERPGVTVLHDAVLQHFFLGSLERGAYVEEFIFNYGEWSRDFAADLWLQRARSAADPRYFEFPMLRRIAERSRAVIVHNPAAARMVARHAPGATIHEIPHLFDAPPLPSLIETLRFRKELGLKPRTLVAGVFGHLRESKRLPVVLRAMRRVWNAGGDAVLLVAGEFASKDLERSVDSLLHDPRILRVPHLPERDFWRFAAITDVCVNLRYPSAGETSGILVRMMGIGKAVVCTEGEEIARIPENACLRIDAGTAEEEMLAETIRWLAGDRGAAEEIGARAARHIASEHAVEKIARRYWEVCSSAV